MAIRFKPPDQKSEAQELLRQEQSRAAPTVGASQETSLTCGAGGGGGRGGRRISIHLLRNGKAEQGCRSIGITDGSKTQVKDKADSRSNDPVIIGIGSGAQSQTGVVNPFQPSQPRGFGFR